MTIFCFHLLAQKTFSFGPGTLSDHYILKTKSKSIRSGIFLFSPSTQTLLLFQKTFSDGPETLSDHSTVKTKSKSVRSGIFVFSPSTQAFLLAFLLAQKMFSPGPGAFSPGTEALFLIFTFFSFLLAFLLALCSMKIAFSPSFSPRRILLTFKEASF